MRDTEDKNDNKLLVNFLLTILFVANETFMRKQTYRRFFRKQTFCVLVDIFDTISHVFELSKQEECLCFSYVFKVSFQKRYFKDYNIYIYFLKDATE